MFSVGVDEGGVFGEVRSEVGFDGEGVLSLGGEKGKYN